LDEELPFGQERRAPENLPKVGWAKSAQPSSRSQYATPPLQSFTRIKPASKAKPSAGASPCILNRGLAAVYSGANSIASALHLLNGRDPAENQSHSNPELSVAASKPDISTWQRIGHFYFALTLAYIFKLPRLNLAAALWEVEETRVTLGGSG
jgi:hypothetical protein